MFRDSDRRLVFALFGCVGALLVILLIVSVLLGTLAVVTLRRAPASPTTNATATFVAALRAGNIPYIPPTATFTPTATATAPPLATRPRATPPNAAAGTPEASQAMRTIALPVNDLAYDPFSQRLWASVPGRGGERGNSIVPIDPVTGAIGTAIFVGSEPKRLALSDDGHYLYVALDGTAAVRRVDIRSGTADMQFSLGKDKSSASYYAEDIAVLPGKAEAVAVARSRRDVGPLNTGVAIYVDGVALPNATTSQAAANVIEFCGAADTLYGYNNESSEYGFRQLSVDSAGVAVRKVSERLITGYNVDIKCDGELVYATSGQVIDTRSLTVAGTMQGLSGNTAVAPDAATGRVYYLTQAGANLPDGSGQVAGVPSPYRLLAFEQQTFRQVWSFDLPGMAAPAPAPREGAWKPGSLVRWGADGVAFRFSPDHIALVRIGAANSPRPATATPRPIATVNRVLGPTPTPPLPRPTASPAPAATAGSGARPSYPTTLPAPVASVQAAVTMPGHAQPVRTLAWSPDGAILASGGSDNTARLWRADGAPLATLTGHTGAVMSLAWSSDGARLATAANSPDANIRLWDPTGSLVTMINAHQGGVTTITWSPDGKLLASSGADRALRIWARDGTPRAVIEGLRWPTTQIAWAPYSATLAFALGGSTVQVYDVNGTLQGIFRGHQPPASVTGLVWRGDDTLLASSDSSGKVFLWRPDGTVVRALPPLSGVIMNLAWSPDSTTIATGGIDHHVRLWR